MSEDAPKKKQDKKTCFVISPIGVAGSPTRLRADKLKKYVIERVLKPKGYIVKRADDVGEPGIITNQIVRSIVECDILIADLSEHNPNVFYELALRHGLKKPFIHIIDIKDDIPFDNAQVRTIQVDLTDLDSVESACEQLISQIEAIEKGDSVVESPISIAFDLENLRSSGKPDETVLSLVLEELSTLRRDFRSLNIRSRGIGVRYSIPKDWDQFLNILSREESDLADYVRTTWDIEKYDPPLVYGSFKGGANWRDCDDEVAKIMERLTGRKWEISIVPF